MVKMLFSTQLISTQFDPFDQPFTVGVPAACFRKHFCSSFSQQNDLVFLLGLGQARLGMPLVLSQDSENFERMS